MAKEDEEAEWNVPCSDEETASDDITLPVVKLYEQIKQQQVLELRVREYRAPKLDPAQQELCEADNSGKATREAGENDTNATPAEEKATDEAVK